jgi:DNA transposition AAA+ family ATPase
MPEQTPDTSQTGGYVGDRRGDHINISRAAILQGIAQYPQERQDLLIWLHGYCLDVLHGSRSALVDWLQVHWSTVIKIWTGKYDADIAQFCQRLQHLRAREVMRASTHFVETTVTRRIFSTIEIARQQNAMAMIVGPSGRSKTHAARQWQTLNNHGVSTYVECPVSGGLRGLIDAIANAMGTGKNRPNSEMMPALERSFDYRNVLIFDEVARLLPARSTSIHPIEFIRRLHDVCGCGVVLIATDVFPAAMRGGPLRAWFEQLSGRIAVTLRIPAKIQRKEAAEICSAFTDDPQPDLIEEALRIGNADGHVRVLFGLLRNAAQLAQIKGEPLAFGHLRSAGDLRESLNRWESD